METGLLKEEIIKSIKAIDDKAFLEELDFLLQQANQTTSDFWNELPENIKQKIDVSQEEIRSGKFISDDDLSREIKDRFKV